MAKLKFSGEFPCGYKYNLEVCGFGLSAEGEDFKLQVCPLHGKRCKGNKK